MNAPDDRNRQLADALADLADAADRVASAAKNLRGDLDVTEAGSTGPAATPTPGHPAPPTPTAAPVPPPGGPGPGAGPGWQTPPLSPHSPSRGGAPRPPQGPVPGPAPGQPLGRRQLPQSGPAHGGAPGAIPGAPGAPGVPPAAGPGAPGVPAADGPGAGAGESPGGPPGQHRTGVPAAAQAFAARFRQPGPDARESDGAPPAPSPYSRVLPPTPMQLAAREHPWWEDEKIVLRITAAVGALITISGVILLLAFAIQSGLLGPLGRVILAYGLAVALAVVAVVVHRKNPGNAGVTAAGSAATITAHITTSVLVNILEWWPNWLGTLVVLAVMGIAYAGARWWNSVAFHMIAFVISYFTVCTTVWPKSSDDFDVIAAILIAPVAAAWAWRDRPQRPMVSLTAAALYLIGSVTVLNAADPDWLAVAAFIVAGIAIAVPEFLDDSAADSHETESGESAPREVWVPGASLNTEELKNRGLQTLYALIWPTPLMLTAIGPGEKFSPFVALFLGLAIGGAGFGPWKPLTDPRMSSLRWAGFFTAAVPALQLSVTDPHSTWTRLPALLVAAAITWIFVFRPTVLGKRLLPLWVAVALLGNMPALILTMFSPSYLVEHQFRLDVLDAPNVPLSALLIGVIALGLIAILVANRGEAGRYEKSAALIGLLLTAVPVIIVLTSAGMRFSLAHMLLSIGWMIAAAWMMLAPKRLNIDANMAASLVIAGVAVLKLVFYDMQAMSGLTRVSAFLLCGLVLLGMVVARNLRDQKADRVASAAAPGKGAEPGKVFGTGSPGTDGPRADATVGGAPRSDAAGAGSHGAGAGRYDATAATPSEAGAKDSGAPGPEPDPWAAPPSGRERGRDSDDGWGTPPGSG